MKQIILTLQEEYYNLQVCQSSILCSSKHKNNEKVSKWSCSVHVSNKLRIHTNLHGIIR